MFLAFALVSLIPLLILFAISRKLEEKGQLISLFLCISVIVFLAFLLSHEGMGVNVISNPLTADYSATLKVGSNLYLTEDYVYHVHTSKYRALYRRFNAPLLFQSSSNEPHYTLLTIFSSYPEYAVDCFGHIYLWDAYNAHYLRELIREHASKNEVGIVNSHHFNPGNYEVKYKFEIFPPVQTDGKLYHVNIKLASEHVPYDRVVLKILDPQKEVKELFVHFPDSKVVKTDYGWIITGKSPENGLIEVEMLLTKPVNGYLERVSNVQAKTVSANKFYEMEMKIVKNISYIYVLLALIFPGIIYYIYVKYGSEIKVTVPKFLSYVPNNERKPWVVNLAFKGDAFTFDADGFFATLLNLEKMGLIKLETYGNSKKDLRIKIIKEKELEDEYERNVFDYIKNYSEDGVFDTANLRKTKDLVSMITGLKEVIELKNLMLMQGSDLIKLKRKVEKEFIDVSGKKALYKLLAFSFLVAISGVAVSFVYPQQYSATMGIATLYESLACLATPTQLFGRWKEREYEERLQWRAFARFLSDMAMIKKYAPEDIVMWQEWLVYGTALGVGDKVAKAMKALDIEIDTDYSDIFVGFHTFYSAASTKDSSSFGGVGGGGFGGGSGFGGGGAGGW